MTKNNKWRLVSDVLAMFPVDSPNSVYITSLDNKKQESIIAEEMEKHFGANYTKQVVNNEFHLQVNELGVFIKCDNFINSSKWYLVCNFKISEIYRIISQVKNDLGVFTNDIFEAIFNDDLETIKLVSFTTQSMDNYNSCFEEMGRRVICDMSKKTKKRIPGHRYDSTDKSLYYLGTFVSRNNSDTFACDSKVVPVDLYATSITKDDKTISDVFKNHAIGYDIIAMNTAETLVDFGEILKNDFDGKDIQDYWEYLYENSIKNAKESSNKIDNYGKVLNMFSYQSSSNLSYTLSPKIDLNKYIKDILLKLLKLNWDINNKFRKELEVKSIKPKEDNKLGLVNLFFANLSSSNVYKDVYYSDMLKKLKIDLYNLSDEVLDMWEKMRKDANNIWDSYVNLAPYLGISYISEQRTKNVMKIETKKTLLADLFPESLKNVIIDMAYEANNNFGSDISNYKILNLGTKRSPREFTEIKITLKDLCKSGKLNDKLKEIIMKEKFGSIDILCDRGGKIE